MAKQRSCTLCSVRVGLNVAAHACPHGQPCRYRCNEDGAVLDWKTPECDLCAALRRLGKGRDASGGDTGMRAG
jgi:hypothetical protein